MLFFGFWTANIELSAERKKEKQNFMCKELIFRSAWCLRKLAMSGRNVPVRVRKTLEVCTGNS